MKTSKIVAAAALSLFAAAGAVHAEEYHGVLEFNSVASRADVAAEAVRAAHGPDLYGEAAYAGVQPVTSERSRADVAAEAVRTAHAPDQNVTAGSRGDQRFFAGTAPRTVLGGRTLPIAGAQ